MTDDTVLKPQYTSKLTIVNDVDAYKRRVRALMAVMDAILESVKIAGYGGAPGGVLYAALMTTGVDLQQFERIMSMLVEAKRLRKSGYLYFYLDPPPRVEDGVQPAVKEA